MALVPSNIEKIKRSQFIKYIDTTPSSTATWNVLGIGITEANVEYNPEVDSEKWIIEDTARNDHKSNQKQIAVTQKCYKNDPEFEFINGCRDKLNCKTHILEIDMWNGNNSSYPAKKSDGIVAVTSYSGEEIEYTLYFDGDSVDGTATISDSVPTFTPSTSL